MKAPGLSLLACLLAAWSTTAGSGLTQDRATMPVRGSKNNAIRPLQRGHAWVRQHPFTLMGLVRNYPRPFDEPLYRRAGFTSLLAWEPSSYDELIPKVAAAKMPFHIHLEHWGGDKVNRKGVTEDILSTAISKIDSPKNRAYIDRLTKHPECLGFLANDEAVNPFYLRYTRQLLQWLRRRHPDKLAFGNAHPDPWNGGYDRYIDEFAAIVEPDVLMTDVYPLSVPDGLAYNYFGILSDIRKTALAHGMPYWMIIQSFHSTGAFDRRLPSESDIRFQIFVPLAMGYTGIIFFTYDVAYETGLIDKNGKPTRLHPDVARANREALHLGKALRFLTSTSFGCVAGTHIKDGQTVRNPNRRSTRALDLTAQPVREVIIESPGERKDALIGFFRDDQGGRYFMVTNLWQNAGATAPERAVPVSIRMAPEVKSLHRLDRVTGEVERIKIKDRTVRITLPGGTGDLFKIDDGKFPGLQN